MRALVLLKRVPDPYAKIRLLPDGSGYDPTGIKFEINPFDEIALEEAVRLKEGGAVTEIVALSVGGAEVEEQLRKGLAMGADRAIRVEREGADPVAVAGEVVAVAREGFDLLLLGKQATDTDDNVVGQWVAAALGWPQATFASKVEIAGNAATVTRETDEGSETLTFPLPAVVTSDLRLNEPRYIALPAIMKAKNKPLERRAPVGAPTKTRTTAYEPIPPRAAGRRVATADELYDAILATGALS